MDVITDVLQLEIKASLLDLAIPGQYVQTDEKSINEISNFKWRLKVYPNGTCNEETGFLYAYVVNTKMNHEMCVKMSVVNSDIKHEIKIMPVEVNAHGAPVTMQMDPKATAPPMNVFQGLLRILKNGINDSFIIRCEITVKKKAISLVHNCKILPTHVFNDTCTLKVKLNQIATACLGYSELSSPRRSNGIDWRIQSFPAGETMTDFRHFKIRLLVLGGPAIMEWSCALKLDQCILYRGDKIELTGDDSSGACVATHEQCRLAANSNDEVEFVVNVKFTIDLEGTTYRDKSIHTVSDTINQILDVNIFEHHFHKEFERSKTQTLPKPHCLCSFVEQKWNIKFYPAGREMFDKGFLTIIIEISNPENKPISVKGSIQIDDTNFLKYFEFAQKRTHNFVLSKLLSIEDLKNLNLFNKNKISITCSADFETH